MVARGGVSGGLLVVGAAIAMPVWFGNCTYKLVGGTSPGTGISFIVGALVLFLLAGIPYALMLWSDAEADEARVDGLLGCRTADLDIMEGTVFEDWIVAHLRKNGIDAKKVGQSGDYGADVIATVGGTPVAIQAKRYEKNVGNKAVQQVLGGMHYWNCARGVVVTQSDFTKPARRQAQAVSPPVILVGRNSLHQLADVLRSRV